MHLFDFFSYQLLFRQMGGLSRRLYEIVFFGGRGQKTDSGQGTHWSTMDAFVVQESLL
jgi:hypothetical protein